MILGNFVFNLKTMTQDGMSRTAEYNWAEKERVGDLPNFQNLGIRQDQIEITGVSYARLNPEMKTIDDIRKSQLTTQANNLITNQGRVLGKFVIISIQENMSVFNKKDIPLKIEFTMVLKRVPSEAVTSAVLKKPTATVNSTTDLSRSYLRW